MTTPNPTFGKRPKIHRSKIARLSIPLRHDLNTKLEASVSGTKIRAWLNSLPEMKAILNAEFDGEPITAQNLSDWRAGGYKDWVDAKKGSEEIEKSAVACFAAASAAGAGFGEGFIAMLGGKIMALKDSTPEEYIDRLGDIIATIRAGDQEKRKLDLKEKDGARDDRRLAMEETKVAILLQSAAEKTLSLIQEKRAQQIADSSGSNAEKIEALGQVMFGEIWTNRKKATA
ncbi:MAG: hypothetical protein HZA88_16575 [Verrucomicrobia bacterium]|nr:hypothetical protein [Verrucomicrobiota bacterium]